MKLLSVFFASILCLVFNANAQVGKVKDKIVINTPTIIAEECKNQVEFFVPKSCDGIISIVVNVKKKTTTVQFLTDRTNKTEIKAAIANLGYDADDFPADPISYKRLSKECKEVKVVKPVVKAKADTVSKH